MTQQNALNELAHNAIRIMRKPKFEPMSDETKARYDSYRATVQALQGGSQLPVEPCPWALSMWEREVLHNHEVTQ